MFSFFSKSIWLIKTTNSICDEALFPMNITILNENWLLFHRTSAKREKKENGIERSELSYGRLGRECKIEKLNHFFLANPGRMQHQLAINWNRLPLSLAFLNSFFVLLFGLHENTMLNYSNKVKFNNKNRTHACLDSSASKFCEKKTVDEM